MSKNVTFKQVLEHIYELCLDPESPKSSPRSRRRFVSVSEIYDRFSSNWCTMNEFGKFLRSNGLVSKTRKVDTVDESNTPYRKRRMGFGIEDLIVAFDKHLKRKKLQGGPQVSNVRYKVVPNVDKVVAEDVAKNKLSKDREAYYRSLWTDSQSEMSRLASLVSLYAHLDDPRPVPPPFLGTTTKKWGLGENHVVFCTMLSDTHFSEVVVPAHVNGVNVYNRKVAEQRLNTYFEKVVKINQEYIKGITLDGLVICLGGDMVSGIIHEELRETNEEHMLEETIYWSDKICAGIQYVYDRLKLPIYLPCVVGNHGRLTKKPIYKYRAEDNLDYLMYLLCARYFKDNPALTFDVAKSSEVSFKIFDTTYILCHGDEFRGGKGISGIYTPIALGRMRKQERELSLSKTYDILLMGHFHQLLYGGNFIINGSLIGANEYSYMNSMKVEPPQQAFWLSSPRGITMFGPIFVESIRASEKPHIVKTVYR